MPTLKDNQVLEYSFTEEELVVASSMTELQTQYLQTMLVLEIQQKNNLSYSPTEGEAAKDIYIFGQEYHRGRVELLQHLLNVSEDNREKQLLLYQQSVEAQQQDEG